MGPSVEQNILSQDFFAQSAVETAPALLGKHLVRRQNGKEVRLMITEVEAYDGFDDKASHARRGKTSRTSVMFGPPGVWYVYLCYGVHEMLNIVTGVDGYPAAVLIRGVEGISGPGRLTKALSIDRALNAKIANAETGLWIEDPKIPIPPETIQTLPRVGVDYAGPEWAGKPWRFVIKNLSKISPQIKN